MSASAFEGFLSTPRMLALFEPTSVVQAMMDFEAALAKAQAEEGVIPQAAAVAIAGVCKAQLYDVAGIVGASARAGSLAIPLVKQLTHTVSLFSPEAAGFVHWGSTSQDVIDTGMALVTRRALALIDRDLGALIGGLLQLAQAHGDAPVLARTLLQPAQVVSFGFKLVEWIAPLVRSRERLRTSGQAALQLQLGGAVGTLAVMGDKGLPVARRVAQALQLRLPAGAWHTQRDEVVSLACEVGILAGALGKIGKDISLMSQGEIGEVSEPSGGGRGGSSAMPHKRDPVASMVALAASIRAPHRVSAIRRRWRKSMNAGSAIGRLNSRRPRVCTSACTDHSLRWPMWPAACRSTANACWPTSIRCKGSCSRRPCPCTSRRSSARRGRIRCWSSFRKK